MKNIKELTKKIKKFRDERDWLQFHDPKNMAISVALEAAELLEYFQWKSKKEIQEYIKMNKGQIAEEMADIMIYLLEFADNLGIDILEASNKKIEKNAKKYPAEKSKGSAKKYDQL